MLVGRLGRGQDEDLPPQRVAVVCREQGLVRGVEACRPNGASSQRVRAAANVGPHRVVDTRRVHIAVQGDSFVQVSNAWQQSRRACAPASVPGSPLTYAHVLSPPALLCHLASSSFGGLVGTGFIPKSGIRPKVCCAGVHLRAPSLAAHLKTAASAVTKEQQTAARRRRRPMVGAGRRVRKKCKGGRGRAHLKDREQTWEDRNETAEETSSGARPDVKYTEGPLRLWCHPCRGCSSWYGPDMMRRGGGRRLAHRHLSD